MSNSVTASEGNATTTSTEINSDLDFTFVLNSLLFYVLSAISLN